jgi:hypothetical protein
MQNRKVLNAILCGILPCPALLMLFVHSVMLFSHPNMFVYFFYWLLNKRQMVNLGMQSMGVENLVTRILGGKISKSSS